MSFVVIGEALVDEFRSGDKVHQTPGGAPLNVAVGLGRLRRNVTLVTRIGDDEAGARIAQHLADSGVRLFPGSIDHRPTSVAHASLDENGVASYTFDLISDYPAPDDVAVLGTPALVHIGSLGAHLQPGAAVVRQWLKALHPTSTISYDPNVRMSLLGSPQRVLDDIDQFIEYVDVVKASDEDLEALLGTKDPDVGAQYFLDRDVSFVVVSQGAAGLKLFTPETTASVRAPRVTALDTIGAGDSLMSALIDGMSRMSVLGAEDRGSLAKISQQGLMSLGAYAAAAAAITVTRAGANPPTRTELNLQMDLLAGTTIA